MTVSQPSELYAPATVSKYWHCSMALQGELPFCAPSKRPLPLGGPTHVVAGSRSSKGASLSDIGVFSPLTASSEPLARSEKASVGEPKVALPMSTPRTSRALDQSTEPMLSTSGRSRSSGTETPAALSPRRRLLPPSAPGTTNGSLARLSGAVFATESCRSGLEICTGGAPTSTPPNSAPPTIPMPATSASETSLPAVPPLVASSIVPSVLTATSACSAETSPPG